MRYSDIEKDLSEFLLTLLTKTQSAAQGSYGHEKSWNLKMHFPGLEKSWNLGKMTKVMEKS